MQALLHLVGFGILFLNDNVADASIMCCHLCRSLRRHVSDADTLHMAMMSDSRGGRNEVELMGSGGDEW